RGDLAVGHHQTGAVHLRFAASVGHDLHRGVGDRGDRCCGRWGARGCGPPTSTRCRDDAGDDASDYQESSRPHVHDVVAHLVRLARAATIRRRVTAIVKRDYSLTGDESQRAVARGLAQAQWYRTDVPRKRMKELMQRRNGPAMRGTLLWLALLILFGGLGVYLWFSVWSLLCFAVYGVMYGSASDARWHECGHGTAFKTRWMNSVVYQIACFMIMRDPTVWRWGHVRHHTDTIIVGRDPEIVAMRPPAIGRIAADFLGIFAVPAAFRHMAVHASGRLTAEEATFVPETERSKTYW